MASSTISYLWRDTKRAQRLPIRCFLAQPHQPVAGDAGFSGQLRQPVPVDAAVAVAAGAALRAECMECGSNYAASYWTPPMTPKLAFDLESQAD